jgi:hypothetical protein
LHKQKKNFENYKTKEKKETVSAMSWPFSSYFFLYLEKLKDWLLNSRAGSSSETMISIWATLSEDKRNAAFLSVLKTTGLNGIRVRVPRSYLATFHGAEKIEAWVEQTKRVAELELKAALLQQQEDHRIKKTSPEERCSDILNLIYKHNAKMASDLPHRIDTATKKSAVIAELKKNYSYTCSWAVPLHRSTWRDSMDLQYTR